MRSHGWLSMVITLLLIAGCHHEPRNNPYHSRDATANTYYGAFATVPKTLDPAKSYTTNEAQFISLIYEPPLQYQYLTRPWALEPLLAREMPVVIYRDASGHVVNDAMHAKSSEYIIHIKPGVYYQPHPAFARNKLGHFAYWPLTAQEANRYRTLADFKLTGSREVTADDFVYEIKRLASPNVQSPIYGLMSEHIAGLIVLRQQLQQHMRQHPDALLDLRNYPLTGAEVIDRYTYRIRLSDPYPQFNYWLAMSFFSPYPWEADYFYHNPGFANHNLTIDWYPIGTGPYQLIENNPNQSIQLVRNKNFHGEQLPLPLQRGTHTALPNIDRIEFYLEKESIPRWNKFLQGYYDQSGIASDSFDEAITYTTENKPMVKAKLRDKGISLQVSTTPSIYYLGFNWLDPVVGGSTVSAQKLRQALSIAVDMDEYIHLFLNGRGQLAQGPLPPGIWGARSGKEGMNPVVYQWRNNHPERRSLQDAKRLLSEAGYPNGINRQTGKPLVLTLSLVSESSIDEGVLYAWYREEFAKLNIELNIESTTYNRFQDKLQNGTTQLYLAGWAADYPDAENFLFLLYGPNSKVKSGGENSSNYQNPQFDRWYEQMMQLPNGDERQAVIDKMIQQLQIDAPWIWGFYPVSFQLSHHWVVDSYSNPLVNNQLKYMSVLPQQRYQARMAWNNVAKWPIVMIMLALIAFIVVVVIVYRKLERRVVRVIDKDKLC